METVRDVCKYIGSVIENNPVCIETGSTYYIPEENLIHTTTNNIVDHVCAPNNGMLFSVDIDEEHQNQAKKVTNQNYVKFLTGDSIEILSNLKIPTVDILCLDSKEFDEEHAVKEFRCVEPYLRYNKHFVLVDDIHNTNSVKWKKIVPILKDLDYKYIEVPTPTGLFVATKGYNLEA